MNLKDKLSEFYGSLSVVAQKCGRSEDSLTVLFATKYLNSEQLAAFIDIYWLLKGEKAVIGENRVQDAGEKLSYLNEFHPDLKNKFYPVLIGNLQKNKINKALNLFEEFHAVDSLELASDINFRAANRNVPVFLEVNISGEKSKHGISSDTAPEVIERVNIMPNLKLEGLMTMAPEIADKTVIRKVFRKLKKLAAKYELKTSMGMSHDWQTAVEEGSDILRIGSKLFK
ncbi:MAG: hypothetical protein UV73_C0005G0090 [Candidatus Gottesmanbacteria bacterium GW2011_GWA2_43_14]|uniref:Alanine racemase N-terminal domain-containing protein n=1 Tax=Candidatus Gottesmanbacteria bacterium GW2011_GWA2_43_14 TaxID=1618443 RepID=A0A0G1GG58_9BACT|nr:MAG: hypothetical protein UV73_C0005G0090 [Candidatus Gottesmanbacteria bacterium GW2011_GWA2_43_14]